MDFTILRNAVSNLTKWYNFTEDSVLVTLFCITIITLFCMLYNLLAFLREKYHSDEGLDSSVGHEISTERCGRRLEGHEAVPQDAYQDLVNVIHIFADRMNREYLAGKCIELLIKNPDAINTPKPPAMYTPFLRACLCGNANAIKFMLQYGADITSQTRDGDTPMHLAVYSITKEPQAFDPVCINILYNAGCSINTPKHHGYTPMHLAARAGNANLVLWLLAHGAQPNIVTECNKTAADIAIKYGHTEVASLLTVRLDDEPSLQGTLQDQNNQ